MTVRRRKATGYVWECKCERCGHRWTSYLKARPKQCPQCHARHFDRPARWKKPKRS